MLENQKKCTKCFIIKSLFEFYTDNNKKDKTKNTCKECDKKKSALHKKNNKDAVKTYKDKYNKEYYVKNKEDLKKYKKENEERDKEKRKERDNTERGILLRREYDRRRKLKDPEKRKREGRESYSRNAEKRRAEKRQYRKDNLEKCNMAVRNSCHKRREQKYKTTDGTLPINPSLLTKQLQELLQQQDHKCNNCRCCIKEKYHLDHHIPLSKGGTHTLSNVVFLCPTCNLKKHNKIPDSLMLVY